MYGTQHEREDNMKNHFRKSGALSLAVLMAAASLFTSSCTSDYDDTQAPWTTEAPETIPWTTDDIESNGFHWEGTEPVEDVTDTFETDTPETDAPETLVGPGYELSDGTLTILDDDAMVNYDDPQQIPWYEQRESITKVVISDGVTKIGEDAFSNCTNLSSVKIPSSVTHIGVKAFSACENLKGIVIPNGVKTIDDNAFSYSGLVSITLPDSLQHIGELAFSSCYSLTFFTIPANVETFSSNILGGCESLTKVTVDANNKYFSSDEAGVLFNKDKTTLICYPEGNSNTEYKIPNSVTVIGEEAFSGSRFKSVVIPDGVEVIESGAFKFSGIESVTLPNSVQSIGAYAFYWCSGLKSVTIPNGITTISEGTFGMSAHLESVAISSSVKIIEKGAFVGCNDLKEIKIPADVLEFDFDGIMIEAITVDKNNKCFSSDEYGVLFNKDKTVLLYYPKESENTEYTVPKGVEKIANSAFESCDNLKSVIISDGVTDIGDYAFQCCKEFVSVEIPDSVANLGEFVFNGCDNLKTINFKGSEAQWNAIENDHKSWGDSVLEYTVNFGA